jgi:diguanylate cyclase (GGDEF)-like protein
VKEVNSGASCLDTLKKSPIDLVVLDAVMDGISGFDVLKIMKANKIFSNIPVLMVTSLDDTDAEIKALELGANDFIKKPIFPPIVRHRVQRELKVMDMMETIAALNERDELTQIANRRGFNRRYEQEWAKALRLNRTTPEDNLGVFVVDIDFFKRVNDTYGHPDGDECLRQVAALLSNGFSRAADFVARFGGEEFVVLSSRISKAEYYVMGIRIVELLRNNPIKLASVDLNITCTVGGVFVQPGIKHSNKEEVFKLADDALYHGKQNGRDRFVCAETIS